MRKNRMLALLLLLLTLAALLCGCGKTKTLDEDQYDISANSYYGQTTFTITILDEELIDQGIEAVSVKIKYYNYLEKAKTETFDTYLYQGQGSFSVDEVIITHDCKKVEATFENAPADPDKPSIFSTIGLAVLLWLICFVVVFIPRLFFDSDGTLSIGIAGLIYIVFTIYAYASWGIGRGIICTVGLVALVFCMNAVVDWLQELWDEYIRGL